MSIINKIQNLPWNQRNVNQITQIVIHHSAYRQDNQDNQSRFENLRQMHLNNGWYGLSYHFVIFKNGEIWQCNNFTDASPTDGINYPSLAILVDGYFHDNKDKPTIEQLKSLDYLLGDLCNNHPEFPAVRDDVKGHREVNSTICCGSDLINYVIEWRNTGKLNILEQPTTTTPTTTTMSDNKEYGYKLLDAMKNKGIINPDQFNNWLRPRLDVNGTDSSIDTIIELFNNYKTSELVLNAKLNNSLLERDNLQKDFTEEIELLKNQLNPAPKTPNKFKFDWNKQYELFIKSGAWKILIGFLIAAINPLAIKYLGYPLTEQQLLNVLSIFAAGYGGFDAVPLLAGKINEKLKS